MTLSFHMAHDGLDCGARAKDARFCPKMKTRHARRRADGRGIVPEAVPMAVPGPPLDRVFLNGEGLSTGYPQV